MIEHDCYFWVYKKEYLITRCKICFTLGLSNYFSLKWLSLCLKSQLNVPWSVDYKFIVWFMNLLTGASLLALAKSIYYCVLCFFGRFPFNPKFRKFRWFIRWNGPFRFGPTGTFGTSFEGGPQWSVWLFRSVEPKCAFSFAKIHGCPQYRSFVSCLQEQVVSIGKSSTVVKPWHLK